MFTSLLADEDEIRDADDRAKGLRDRVFRLDGAATEWLSNSLMESAVKDLQIDDDQLLNKDTDAGNQLRKTIENIQRESLITSSSSESDEEDYDKENGTHMFMMNAQNILTNGHLIL